MKKTIGFIFKKGCEFICSSNYRFKKLNQLGMFNHLPDEEFLKRTYKAYFGKELDLETPKTFNEKLQWLKLYDRKPEYTTMVDKYEAKKYVAERIGEEYIIPTLGVWDRFDDIDFDALPDQFVLKTTHDSGGVVICRDKANFDRDKARKKLSRSLKRNFYLRGREWPYKDVKPRIIAEQFMQDGTQPNGLLDYKFYCFNGEPKLLYVSEGLEDHSTAKISFLDLDWTFADFHRSDFRPFDHLPPKPNNYDQMLILAKELSAGIPFLRVDLYEINGKIYFSELTFFPCSGMMPFEPERWNEKLGSWIMLPPKETK